MKKDILKKYLWILLLIILIPCAINFIMIQPRIYTIVGNDTSWLSFWGSYLGGAISSAIALFILWKQLNQNHQENEDNRNENHKENEDNRNQNHKENEDNRKLQLAIIKHEQGKTCLSQLKNTFADFISSYNYDEINRVVGNMLRIKYCQKDYDSLLHLLHDIEMKNYVIDFYINNLPKTESLNNYILAFNASYNSYVFKISNLICFYIIMGFLPKGKDKKIAYVTDMLEIFKKDSSKNKKEVDGFIFPKSIASIIEEKGCYDKIIKNSPAIIKTFTSQFDDEISLKENIASTIMDLIISEEKRIDDELYN